MRKKTGAGVVAVIATAGAFLLGAGGADAHHPEVEVTCLAWPATLRVTATAWDAPTLDERVNHQVQITFDGVPLTTGVFDAANGYHFTVDVAAPVQTGTHVVRATTLARWGANEDDPDPVGVGEYREATVTLPCGDAPVVTAPTPAPTTTVPTEVEATTVTRDVAPPVAVQPRFAG